MLVTSLHRWLALLWLLALVAAGGYLLQRAAQGNLLTTDIYSFLPPIEDKAAVRAAEERFSQRRSRQLILLLTANDSGQLVAAATALRQALEAQHDWQLNPVVANAGDMGAIWRFYAEQGPVFLSVDDRRLLQQGDYSGFVRSVTLGYINPVAMSGALLEQDPLLLLQHFLVANPASAAGFRLVDGWPLQQQEGGFGLILPFSTRQDVYSLARNRALVEGLQGVVAAVQPAFPTVQLQMVGPLLHVYQGVEQSEREVSRVGLGSLVGILLIFILWLRSPLPLLSSVLVLGAGMLASFAVMVAVFGSVHLIALVFSATVLGMGIDYALHFFAHRSSAESGQAALQTILVPTGLGMATSALAFLALSWVPFPGFQQVAWMAALGLLFVWISVVLWLPLLSGTVQARTHFLQWGGPVFQSLAANVGSRAGRLGAGLLLVVMVWGIVQLHPNDDIRQLQAVQPALKQAEQTLQQWLQQRMETAYFLVQGASDEEVLTRMENLCAALREGAHDVIGTAQCLTDWLPSLARQQQNVDALQLLLSNGDSVWQAMTNLGLDPSQLAQYRQGLSNASRRLTPAQFWNGPLAGRWQWLWLGHENGLTSAVVTVADVHDYASLRAQSDRLPGIYWVDEVGRFSEMFGQFRQQGSLFVFMSYVVLLLLLALRYGWRGALGILGPVLMALVMVLGLVGWLQLPFNLFSVLALILVAGMGIDYGIFMREVQQHQTSTRVAVIMSAFTTLLAFGLLALSDTAAISSFGQVILIGISVVLVCTLLTHSITEKEGHL